jgi:hypothetical protein
MAINIKNIQVGNSDVWVRYSRIGLLFSSGEFQFKFINIPKSEIFTELADACKNNTYTYVFLDKSRDAEVKICINNGVVKFVVVNVLEDNNADGCYHEYTTMKYKIKANKCVDAFREAAELCKKYPNFLH